MDFGIFSERPIENSGQLTITGLADGNYYYRLADNDRPLSAPLLVTVQHHSLIRAGSFFTLGLLLFSILVITILIGRRQTDA